MARKILLADDSVTAQNMGRKILTDAGYEVITVNNGSAALKRVSEHKPDLIVLDVYMPGYSGLEVCQRLKESAETARIPILLTVGKLEPFKAEDARRVNADAHIVKPFEASELLSAVTRLEDRVVPQADGQRFSTTVSGLERFASDAPAGRSQPAEGADLGWKSRIRFPSKKPKAAEPEPEPDYGTAQSFRDFRQGPAKPPVEPPAVEAPAAETSAPAPEPGPVPDIPRDITPDELDALSALVAKLDGPVPQAEHIAPLADKVGPAAPAPAKSETRDASAATAETAPAAPAEAATVAAAEAPRAEQAVSSEPPTVASADQAAPASRGEDAAPQDTAIAAAAPAKPETKPNVDEYTTAPVDRNDEPLFASAPSTTPQEPMKESRELQAEVSAEKRDSTQPSQTEAQAKTETPAPAVEAQAPEQPKIEGRALTEDQSKAEQSTVQETAAPVAEAAAAAKEAPPEERAPTDEELAAALRLLTPQHDAVSKPAEAAASLEPAEPIKATEAAAQVQITDKALAAGHHWLAERAELTPQEMSASLEAEMFLALAAPPAAAAEPAPAKETASPSCNEVVEAAVAQMVTQAAVELTSALSSPPAVVTEAPAAVEAKQEDVPSGGSAEQQAEEPVAATFADAVNHVASAEATLEPGESTVAESAEPAALQGDQQAPEEASAEGEESMSKHAKTGKGKAGWHQIHAASAPSPMTDLVEAVKSEVEPAAEEPAKAMAAAAAAGDSASSDSAPDPNTIASIVDSVLADLRPRIVEEIAKKLAKK